MKSVFEILIGCLAIMALSYLLLALLLLVSDRSVMRLAGGNGKHPSHASADSACASEPELELFSAHDGNHMPYHRYPAESENVLVLLKRSDAGNGQDALARHISANGLAHVYIPTLSSTQLPQTKSTANGDDNLVDDAVEELIRFIADTTLTGPVYLATCSSNAEMIVQSVEKQSKQLSIVPELSFFSSRDGAKLAFRYYPAATKTVLILLHGAASHSGLYAPLAQTISRENLAQVFTPNLRGHYRSGARWGDVDYIGQLEDDLKDMIEEIQKSIHHAKIIVGGHSLGGGLAIRFAGGQHGKSADAFILLAPYLGPRGPTRQGGYTSWARAYPLRGWGLTMLNAIHFRKLNRLTVLEFDTNSLVCDGADTPHYSYRLFMSVCPRLNFLKDLHRITQPLLVLVGQEDDLFDPASYAKIIRHTTGREVSIVRGAGHLGIIYSVAAHDIIKQWLNHLKMDS